MRGSRQQQAFEPRYRLSPGAGSGARAEEEVRERVHGLGRQLAGVTATSAGVFA